MRLSSIFVLLSCLLFASPLLGQQQFILNAEVGGKAFIFGSLSLESYWEKPQFGIGLGAGFTSINNFSQMLTDSMTNEVFELQTTEINLPLTAYAYKTFGKDKNRLIIPVGFTTLMILDRNTARGESSLEVDQFLPLPFVGLGYELHGEKVIFRLPVYALYLGEDQNDIFPAVLPWLGLGFGFRLGA